VIHARVRAACARNARAALTRANLRAEITPSVEVVVRTITASWLATSYTSRP